MQPQQVRTIGDPSPFCHANFTIRNLTRAARGLSSVHQHRQGGIIVKKNHSHSRLHADCAVGICKDERVDHQGGAPILVGHAGSLLFCHNSCTLEAAAEADEHIIFIIATRQAKE